MLIFVNLNNLFLLGREGLCPFPKESFDGKADEKSELFVMTKAKDLAKYILTITEKSPKKFRFTLVVRIQNYILDGIEKMLGHTKVDTTLQYAMVEQNNVKLVHTKFLS